MDILQLDFELNKSFEGNKKNSLDMINRIIKNEFDKFKFELDFEFNSHLKIGFFSDNRFEFYIDALRKEIAEHLEKELDKKINEFKAG